MTNKRIVPLFVGHFASAGIKMGRFTGLTRDDVNRANAMQDVLTSDPSLRRLFGETIPANWQLTRQEMLAHPPHILITNYAMLEHLLLFPRMLRSSSAYAALPRLIYAHMPDLRRVRWYCC